MRARVDAGDREGMQGALRASLGVGTRPEDVDALLAALHELIELGPQLELPADGRAESLRAGSRSARAPGASRAASCGRPW